MAASVQSHSNFQAAWPKSLDPNLKSPVEKIARLFQRALYYLFFPVTIPLSYVRNLVCRAIMPGAVYIQDEIPDSYFEIAKIFVRFVLNPNAYKVDLREPGQELLDSYGGKRVQLKTPDHVLIKGAYFHKKGADRVVIFSGGNNSQWELQRRWLEILQPLGVSVMLLNPRGVGSSNAPRSPDGWALDFYTACQYLIKKKNYDPERVLPLGFSMGAATATRGAALVQEEYPEKKISCVNLCSFSHLTREVDAIMKGVLGRIAYVGFKVLQIDMPVKKKWDTLKGEKVVIYRPTDEVIPFKASMARATQGDTKTRILPLEKKRFHHHYFTSQDIKDIRNEVRRILGMRIPFFQTTPQSA